LDRQILRQLGEALAQDLAVRAGIELDATLSQADRLYRLSREIQLDGNIRNLFHTQHVEGNKATHGFRTQCREAMDGLRGVRALAIWYLQSLDKDGSVFRSGSSCPAHRTETRPGEPGIGLFKERR